MESVISLAAFFLQMNKNFCNLFLFCTFICLASFQPLKAETETSKSQEKTEQTLSECIISHVTGQDKTHFIQWLIVMYAQHPAGKDLVKSEKNAVEEVNKKYAQLFVRLVTEDCKPQVQAAIKRQGSSALYSPFRILGEVSGQEVFQSSEVTEAVNGGSKYIDEKELQKALNLNGNSNDKTAN